jgi:hypothetical protein
MHRHTECLAPRRPWSTGADIGMPRTAVHAIARGERVAAPHDDRATTIDAPLDTLERDRGRITALARATRASGIGALCSLPPLTKRA